MGDNAGSFKETRRSNALRPVDDLSGENERAGGDFFTERTDGGKCDDGADAERFESGDVGAGGNGGRRDGVAFSVSCDEGDLSPGWEGTDGYWGAWEAPRL